MQAIKRGEVWWVAFDPAVGGEIHKTRPSVVVSNNAANAVLNRVVVVPLSSQTDKLYPSEARVKVEGRESKAKADQITTASKERLRNRMGALSPRDLKAVEDAMLVHLGIRR
jgi:mRNA interferase MazF